MSHFNCDDSIRVNHIVLCFEKNKNIYFFKYYYLLDLIHVDKKKIYFFIVFNLIEFNKDALVWINQLKKL